LRGKPKVILQGKVEIPAGAENVWEFVSDPAKVIQCVPGIQSYRVDAEKRVSATVRVTIGFIRGVFQATSRLMSEDPVKKEAVLGLTGSGAGSGFSATVKLKVSPAGTSSELSYDADVTISGPLGSIARPLIEGNVRKIVEELFACVKTKVS
jgi:carbon monoxide dehydrogenase subunit G